MKYFPCLIVFSNILLSLGSASALDFALAIEVGKDKITQQTVQKKTFLLIKDNVRALRKDLLLHEIHQVKGEWEQVAIKEKGGMIEVALGAGVTVAYDKATGNVISVRRLIINPPPQKAERK